ncbi:chlorophyll A-B binding protein [Nitzschia inconspicua]|uniref:Chlorophyll A-B binding protein n=1 Tax=Nitzschia inconspicua TaxID=303405 RepID=A0A9K3PL05_9STRA|nr:chlorophyll A-B binding protein [Nitzschia inconspicua]
MVSKNNNDSSRNNNNIESDDDEEDDKFITDGALSFDQQEFLRRELTRLESLEEVLEDLEEYCAVEGMCEDDDDETGTDDDDDDFNEVLLDELTSLDELFSLLQDNEDDYDDDMMYYYDGNDDNKIIPSPTSGIRDNTTKSDDNVPFSLQASRQLEQALLQGVVPVDASVGRDTIPGDWGFDPLQLANKDYIRQGQYRLLTLIGGNPQNDPPPSPRPAALILRDYREAEIRHGRLAMLAVVCWPLQEKLDQLLLDDDQFGPILYGPVTLPYFPLLMTLILLLLGYLDIYAKAIQEEEGIGDAFLPGDCFWDPLKILEGAPPSMKRNMQEREIINGRMAMIAFAAFCFEEAVSHKALVSIPSNELLFEPAYQVPFIQEWLDQQFSNYV